jgi:hypothetical protein
MSIAVGFGSVWVGMGNGDVVRRDVRSGRVVARLHDGHTAFVHDIVVAFGSVWALSRQVTRIDPRRNLARDVRGIRSPSAVSIRAGAGAVWVADAGRREILRIDPISARLIARIRVPGRLWGLAAGSRSLVVTWAPTKGAVTWPQGIRVLQLLDPRTNKLAGPSVRLPCDAGIAVGRHAVWTLNTCSGVLARRDPHTLKIRWQRAMHVLSQSPLLAFGSLWLARRGGALRVDPTTLRIEAVIPVRSVMVVAGSGAVWGFDAGWVDRRPTLRRIDPRTNRVVGLAIRFGPKS